MYFRIVQHSLHFVSMVEVVRVLELFSGVGGMHRAADIAASALTNTTMTVVGAVDINTVSNEIYKHNHPTTNHMQKNITGMTVSQVMKLSPDLVLMSPPCQPHTRQGKQLDTKASWKQRGIIFKGIILRFPGS